VDEDTMLHTQSVKKKIHEDRFGVIMKYTKKSEEESELISKYKKILLTYP